MAPGPHLRVTATAAGRTGERTPGTRCPVAGGPGRRAPPGHRRGVAAATTLDVDPGGDERSASSPQMADACSCTSAPGTSGTNSTMTPRTPEPPLKKLPLDLRGPCHLTCARRCRRRDGKHRDSGVDQCSGELSILVRVALGRHGDRNQIRPHAGGPRDDVAGPVRGRLLLTPCALRAFVARSTRHEVVGVWDR